jgi:hypothetical protein
MHVEMKHFTRDGLLRGRQQGRRDFAELCGLLAEADSGELVFLDFDKVRAVNGSWLNEGIGRLFRWTADEQHNVYPVLTRFPDSDLDELELVGRINGQAYPVAKALGEPVKSIRLVGVLDPTLSETLAAVRERGETTGAGLGAEFEGIGATAWNNRLRDLFDLRLLMRRKEGRRQFYSMIAEVVDFDG